MLKDDSLLVPAFRDTRNREGRFSRFEPGARLLRAGFKVHPSFMSLPEDILFEKDQAVTLRDGATIYVDVLRPAGVEDVPVLVAWSPYGKSRGNATQYVALYELLNMDMGRLSGLQKFEGPDPAFWCAQGYAVCNPDPRGAYSSQGNLHWWNRQEGEDYHDLIEWLADQSWCSGKVGTTGNSYLAISQWFVAAEQPEHLAAIAPWEGMSDVYQDLVKRGGIPDYGFAASLATAFVGENLREDLVGDVKAHPFRDKVWLNRTPDFKKITVPAYIVGSYSNAIHTLGTFRAWREIGSAEKWFRIHNSMEWPDYYENANTQDLLKFFNHYLKGIDNDWTRTPRVRYSLLDFAGNDRVEQPATAFPPEDAKSLRYSLRSASCSLTEELQTEEGCVSYDAVSVDGKATFTYAFSRRTILIGYPVLRVWVSAEEHDDIDMFVILRKVDENDRPLEQNTLPNLSNNVDKLTADGASILRYKGSNGRLRASMRAIDSAASTDTHPVHRYDRVEKLAPGQVVRLDIEMFPIGMIFDANQKLQLVISGRNELGGAMPGTENVIPDNKGKHTIHMGGGYDSYLQIAALDAACAPVQPE